MEDVNPEISIIIPVYNRESLIAETLNSLIKQKFHNWECIIVDDHSHDSTVMVVKEFVSKDKRFKLYYRPNDREKGANSCRNFGFELSKGNFIHWFDSDDIVHPECYEISLHLIKKLKVDFCRFSRSNFRGEFHYKFDDSKLPPKMEGINKNHIEKLLTNEIVFNTCNVLWKKVAVGEERFNENIVYADEWEYYSRILSNGLRGISIDKVLVYGRKHPNSTTYEFWNNDPIRKASKVLAIKLVADNLQSKQLLSPGIKKYLINFGFILKEYEIIRYLLERSNAGIIEGIKYRLGFVFYPIIKPIFKIKGKILHS